MLYEAGATAFVGLWALAAPRSFHDDFPGLGMQWVADSPYNEHLVRDVGALYLGFTVLFLWAAARPALGLLRGVATAFALVQVPHVVFHLAHQEGLTDQEWTTQVGSLVVMLGVAGALAAWAWRLSAPGGSAPPSP